jgi:anti-anti-sigma factor
MSTVDVSSESRDGIITLSLSGELDISGTSLVEDELLRAERDLPSAIVIDLRDLRFIDSSGLRLILEADLRARRDQRRLALVPGPDAVHRVFLIALLDKRLEFISSPDDLVESGPGEPAD